MTTLSDTPGEGLADDTDFRLGDIVEMAKGAKFWGEIIAFDNDGKLPGCTVLAVDPNFSGTKHVYPLKQLRRRSPSVASETAALPSGHEGLVALLTKLDTPLLSLGKWSDVRKEVREAIAALGRVEPVACYECNGPLHGPYCPACRPAPQPALALIEELTTEIEAVIHQTTDRYAAADLRRALKRFKGE